MKTASMNSGAEALRTRPPASSKNGKVSPSEVRRMILLDMTEQERRDRIRALNIAICLMEEQGYHTLFLEPMRDDLNRCSITLNGRTWKAYNGS